MKGEDEDVRNHWRWGHSKRLTVFYKTKWRYGMLGGLLIIVFIMQISNLKGKKKQFLASTLHVFPSQLFVSKKNR